MLRRVPALVCGLCWLLACPADALQAVEPATVTSDCSSLRLNQIKVLGSHNSYKQRLPDEVYQAAAVRGIDSKALRYGHPALAAQLALGLRQLELDVLSDAVTAQQHRLAEPLAEKWLGRPLLSSAERGKYQQAGLKTLHLPDIDFASHCPLFADCLLALRHWSDTHPAHSPVFVLMNVKERGAFGANGGGFQPAQWDAELYRVLDRQILQMLGAEKLLRPADVQKPGLSLRDSVRQHGWPALSKTMGQFIFIFDGDTTQARSYQAAVAAREQVLFASTGIDDPQAAILVLNQPVAQQAQIHSAVAAGFIVRTRSDEPLNADATRFNSALQSNAQIISTDFYHGAPQGIAALQYTPAQVAATAPCISKVGLP
jgi:hypothetical protein